MKKINFWSILGFFALISTIIVAFLAGFYMLALFWVLMLLPSYIVGFYLYQSPYLKSVYNDNESNFFKSLPKFIFSGVLILFVIYFVGYIIGKIIN